MLLNTPPHWTRIQLMVTWNYHIDPINTNALPSGKWIWKKRFQTGVWERENIWYSDNAEVFHLSWGHAFLNPRNQHTIGNAILKTQVLTPWLWTHIPNRFKLQAFICLYPLSQTHKIGWCCLSCSGRTPWWPNLVTIILDGWGGMALLVWQTSPCIQLFRIYSLAKSLKCPTINQYASPPLGNAIPAGPQSIEQFWWNIVSLRVDLQVS